MRSFLSLKWQVAIIVSLVLSVGLLLVALMVRKNLEQTYNDQRQRVYQDRQQVLTSSLEALQKQMIKLANHMQGVAGRIDESGQFSSKQLLAVLEQNWADLNFEWGVDSYALFSGQGPLVASSEGELPKSIYSAEWIVSVAQREAPSTRILCRESCWQTVAVPVLLDNQDIGVLAFSQDLADVVLQFRNTTQADVGVLLSMGTPAASNTRKNSQLERQNYHIVALTGGKPAANVLRTYAEKNTFAKLLSNPQQQSVGGESYELSLLQMAAFDAYENARMVVIENVTAQVAQIRSTFTRLFFSSLLVFLLSEAALLGWLIAPMARLKTIAKLLPRLADVNDRQALVELEQADNPGLVENETHELFSSAMSLSTKLRELDNAVNSRTQALKLKQNELLSEKNFVTLLLNHLPVVVLIQNRAGEIQQLNAEGARIFETNGLEIMSRSFHSFMRVDDQQTIASRLQDIFRGVSKSYYHECELNLSTQQVHHFEWRHCLLPDNEESDRLVLSVGLDLTARKNAERNLAWLADHDPLTELMNRRGFQQEFEKALKKSMRNNSSGALIFFDVDSFKEINDTSGHPTGDRLLREIAARLSSVLRDVDVLARLGGDEFAVLAEGIDRQGVLSLAGKLCEAFSDMELVSDSTRHRISLSMGIVSYPEHGTSCDDLMAKADLSMYLAKTEDNARTNWSIYTPGAPENEWLREQVDWKSRIQQALNEGEFIFQYQPIYDINNRSVSHYEALIRMEQPQGKVYAPNLFIPVAEKTGLIYDIDCYVLNRAAEVLQEFGKHSPYFTLSINISAAAISNSSFLLNVERLIQRHGVEPSRLIFELTETYAVKDLSATAGVIDRCRQLGYRFSLDDFGVGYASWFYLRKLPVDFVKIDGSFVRDLATSREDRLFVSAINSIAQGLGKKTIAEYVESREVLDILRQIGVDYAQGYYIGKPEASLMSVDQLSSISAPRCEIDPEETSLIS